MVASPTICEPRLRHWGGRQKRQESTDDDDGEEKSVFVFVFDFLRQEVKGVPCLWSSVGIEVCVALDERRRAILSETEVLEQRRTLRHLDWGLLSQSTKQPSIQSTITQFYLPYNVFIYKQGQLRRAAIQYFCCVRKISRINATEIISKHLISFFLKSVNWNF